jgi:hypothetical protein
MVQNVGQWFAVNNSNCDGSDDAGTDDLGRNVLGDPEESEEGD